jgi:SOS response regulatory protein OraA/RecX
VTLLARRDYCSAELRARLISRGFDPKAVGVSLEDLRDRRYLDDERYLRLFVASHARRGHGPVRIRHELAELGIGAEMAQVAIEEQQYRGFGSDEIRSALNMDADVDVDVNTGEDVTAESEP